MPQRRLSETVTKPREMSPLYEWRKKVIDLKTVNGQRIN